MDDNSTPVTSKQNDEMCHLCHRKIENDELTSYHTQLINVHKKCLSSIIQNSPSNIIHCPKPNCFHDFTLDSSVVSMGLFTYQQYSDIIKRFTNENNHGGICDLCQKETENKLVHFPCCGHMFDYTCIKDSILNSSGNRISCPYRKEKCNNYILLGKYLVKENIISESEFEKLYVHIDSTIYISHYQTNIEPVCKECVHLPKDLIVSNCCKNKYCHHRLVQLVKEHRSYNVGCLYCPKYMLVDYSKLTKVLSPAERAIFNFSSDERKLDRCVICNNQFSDSNSYVEICKNGHTVHIVCFQRDFQYYKNKKVLNIRCFDKQCSENIYIGEWVVQHSIMSPSEYTKYCSKSTIDYQQEKN